MDYSLLLGVHYPARHYTRASLEAVPSFSLDGTLPHTSPLPGGTLPGQLVVAQGHTFCAQLVHELIWMLQQAG
jgi:hypothetical protein